MRTWIRHLAGSVLGTAAAVPLAPGPARLGPATTGDADLAARVRGTVPDPAGYRGLSVALVENGRVRVAGLGDSGIGSAPEVTSDTRFETGSVVKTWTSMLFAAMVADGSVRPTDTLGDLLPSRSFASPAVRDVPLEELVSHRSGLPRIAPGGAAFLLRVATAGLRGADPYAGWDTAAVLNAVSRFRSDLSGRDTVTYSNFGMAVLGHALAERAGKPYPELLRDRLLDPLGMAATGFQLDGAAPPDRAAAGGTAGGRSMAPWSASGYAPAGIGAWSTVGDLASFLSATVAGTAPGVAATKPRFTVAETSRIGYGWLTTRYGNHEITWHNGATGGFTSWVGYDRATGRGAVVLGNTDRRVETIGLALLDATAPAPGDSPTDTP